MSRRLLMVIGLLALTGVGAGTYSLFFKGEPPPVAPVFVDNLDQPLAKSDEFEKLARENPVGMLDQCLARYSREVTGGVHCTFEMQERVGGKPKPPEVPDSEVIDMWVRGDVPDPKSQKTAIEVLMKWKRGAKRPQSINFGAPAPIQGTLFSERPKTAGGLDGKVVTWRPDASIFSLGTPLDPNNDMAKAQSRYCIRDAGLFRSMLRTHEAWKGLRTAGELDYEYVGKQTPPKIGRECHVIKRRCPRVETDAFEVGGEPSTDPKVIATEGFTEVTLYIDAERWLQVGTELYRTEPDGTRVLVGTYYFRDVHLNPTVPPDTFTVEALKKKD
ncbi:hypothetical protein [Frigoriglobus tundricola]|uniref:Uncharacterized protein n=1 Tax=Frigoriglobus tundricola TaxID=2774151 RepID=A0A6M5Z2W0_9BACT|nr:hypothetical protein [Frigoriglobus tundricola]QJW99771.1 hypothetical protein FTUN_7394 [Frigoriglobus tundricola]